MSKQVSTHRRLGGFSLLEMLIAMAILASLLIFSINMISNQVELRESLDFEDESQQAIHVALLKLSQDIQKAYTADPSHTGRVKPFFYYKKDLSNNYELELFTYNYYPKLAEQVGGNSIHVKYVIDSEKKTLTRIYTPVMGVEDLDPKNENVFSEVILENLRDFMVVGLRGEKWEKEKIDTRSSDKLPEMVLISISSDGVGPGPVKDDPSEEVGEKEESKPLFHLHTIVKMENSVPAFAKTAIKAKLYDLSEAIGN